MPSTTIQHAIPSNKFYPPHIDETQSLLRKRLIEDVLPANGRQAKIVAIEAQAGQGKTTLAYQYITHHRLNHIWYQIGKEDADPVLLLTSLLHSLTNTLEGFSSPQLLDIINKGVTRFDIASACTYRAFFKNRYRHFRSYSLPGDLDQTKFTRRQDCVFGPVF